MTTDTELRTKTIPIETLQKILTYNPETGQLFWKARALEMFSREKDWKGWNGRYAGKPAFTARCRNYLEGAIFDNMFRAHRVAWALHHGKWPPNQIDHINGNGADNRIANLREVDNHENTKNRPIRRDNKSGVQGVCWNQRGKRWEANIGVNGNFLFLGYFVLKDDAIARRRAAEIEYGFHPNHGRPA